jgi:hypothetical protein
MQVEYADARERYYISNGGNLEAASNLAWRDINRKWSYSTVNGKPEMMPYAPEAMFPQIPTAIIRNDLDQAGKEIGAKAPLVLKPSTKTASSGGVRWNIGTVGQYGEIETVLNENGEPREYELPVSAKSFNDSVKQLKAAEAARAEEYVKKQRELNDQLWDSFLNSSDDDEAWRAVTILGTRDKIAEGAGKNATGKK